MDKQSNIIFLLADMLLQRLFAEKGLPYPSSNISYSISAEKGIITGEYDNHRIDIDPIKESVIMSAVVSTVLSEPNSRTNVTLPPAPPVAPPDFSEIDDNDVDFSERKSPAESALPGVLEKIRVHLAAAKQLFSEDMYINYDGTVCYPGNYASNSAGNVFPDGLTKNDEDELIDLLCNELKGVEEVPDTDAIVVHLN